MFNFKKIGSLLGKSKKFISDNAVITFLSTLVPDFTDNLKYAVVAGAVAGGGLTVIANAPNPAGQSILKNILKMAFRRLVFSKRQLSPR
jgi:Na+/H+ antiporter NhaD/arsenite permease-like protein